MVRRLDLECHALARWNIEAGEELMEDLLTVDSEICVDMIPNEAI